MEIKHYRYCLHRRTQTIELVYALDAKRGLSLELIESLDFKEAVFTMDILHCVKKNVIVKSQRSKMIKSQET